MLNALQRHIPCYFNNMIQLKWKLPKKSLGRFLLKLRQEHFYFDILYRMLILTPFSLCFSPVFPLLRLVWSWDCWLPAKKQTVTITNTSRAETQERARMSVHTGPQLQIRRLQPLSGMVWKLPWHDCTWHWDLSTGTNSADWSHPKKGLVEINDLNFTKTKE